MFKNGKSKPEPSASNVTVINRGTTVEGEVSVAGTIRIYGRLNGTVRSEGKVIVAEDGVLNGDLYADAADVSGTVEGIIEADRLDLRETATVEGNVIVKKFTTETGAVFIGDCKMPQNDMLPSGRPAEQPPEDEEAASGEDGENGEETSEEPEQATASSNGATGNGGVKPLPNKPGDAEEQAENADEPDQSEDEARPRFW